MDVLTVIMRYEWKYMKYQQLLKSDMNICNFLCQYILVNDGRMELYLTKHGKKKINRPGKHILITERIRLS